MNLHIEVKGAGDSLVFFHGWGFDHKIWLSLVPMLSTQFKLHLVDLPGFGLSPRMSWDEFKERIITQLPDHFRLIGWSMGGLFAMRLAIEEPMRSTQLINIAASPCFMKDKQWPGVEKRVFANFLLNLKDNPQQALSEFVGLQLKNTSFQYDNGQLPDAISLHHGLQVLAEWDLREMICSLPQSTCFLFGYYDAIVQRSIMRVMQKKYPNFNYFMFEKAAHIPFLSHQEEFITILRGLLQ